MNYKGYKHIRWEQRLKIEGALRTGAKPAAIAQELGVCKKTIYNEIGESAFSKPANTNLWKDTARTWRSGNTRRI